MALFFDTHSHINISPLKEQVKQILAENKKEGIIINNVGVDIDTSWECIKLASKNPGVFATVGIHPTEIKERDIKKEFNELEKMLKNKSKYKIIAIGETGLDLFHNNVPYEKQKEYFLEHIALAKKYNLPLVLHIRDAHEQAWEIIYEKIVKAGLKAVVHCFDSTLEDALKYTKNNIYIGIGGLVTRPNKTEIHKAIQEVFQNRLLSETDCPFLTPITHKGEANRPLFMIDSIKKMAEILKLDFKKLSKQLYNNAISFFSQLKQ